MTGIETRLRRSYDTETWPSPDVGSLLDGARRRGRALRRRRRGLIAFGVASAIAAVLLGGRLVAAPSAQHHGDLPATNVPVPAGPQLIVYRFRGAAGPARVVSFLDTHGRWCVGSVEGADATPNSRNTQCADAGLVPGTSGFGRVATNADAFMYDGISRWMQGVASADVTRVDVVLTDGSTLRTRIVRDDEGVVFSTRISSLKTPVFYRGYDAGGHLIEQLRVPQSVPQDPFLDWRQNAEPPTVTQ